MNLVTENISQRSYKFFWKQLLLPERAGTLVHRTSIRDSVLLRNQRNSTVTFFEFPPIFFINAIFLRTFQPRIQSVPPGGSTAQNSFVHQSDSGHARRGQEMESIIKIQRLARTRGRDVARSTSEKKKKKKKKKKEKEESFKRCGSRAGRTSFNSDRFPSWETESRPSFEKRSRTICTIVLCSREGEENGHS